jgi:hypothetical protein
MPFGLVVVPGWYFAPAAKSNVGGALPMLPGGMLATGGVLIMIVAGWVAFNGNPPL